MTGAQPAAACALVAGPDAAFQRARDQRVQMQFVAHEGQHIERPRTDRPIAGDDLAGDDIGCLAQLVAQRGSDQPTGMLQPVLLPQQRHGGVGDRGELGGGEILEHRQSLHQTRHDADFAVGDPTIGCGDQHHGQDEGLWRLKGVTRTHCSTPVIGA
jgi:hypothetical protein